MKFAIAVYGAPYSSESPLSALRFAEAVLSEGHELTRVFFYHDGVYTANANIAAPQDEPDVAAMWSEFSQHHQIELIACVASCLRRGIVDEAEAKRYEKTASNIRPGFEISGLGQFIDAALSTDRLVTFAS